MTRVQCIRHFSTTDGYHYQQKTLCAHAELNEDAPVSVGKEREVQVLEHRALQHRRSLNLVLDARRAVARDHLQTNIQTQIKTKNTSMHMRARNFVWGKTGGASRHLHHQTGVADHGCGGMQEDSKQRLAHLGQVGQHDLVIFGVGRIRISAIPRDNIILIKENMRSHRSKHRVNHSQFRRY
eukprot:COSAG05_NODE_1887_length_3886_cov_6.005545_4_plen_182_part_00